MPIKFILQLTRLYHSMPTSDYFGICNEGDYITPSFSLYTVSQWVMADVANVR